MPFPVAAAVAAGTQLVGAGVNALQTGNQNRKNRAFTEYMYDRQVQTNRDFWAAQNHYNSPESVMQRNKEAGLNPNFGLVDGQGGAPAGSIASPDTGNFKYESPQSGGGIAAAGSKLAEYQIFERNKLVNEGLELDNANKATQNELYNQDLIIKQFNSQIRGIDFANYGDQKKLSMDALDISNKQGRANLTYTLNEEQRRAAKNTSDLKEAVARVLSLEAGADESRQRIKNLAKDEEIKRMELGMRNLGVQPGSQDWIYAIGMFIRHLMGN